MTETTKIRSRRCALCGQVPVEYKELPQFGYSFDPFSLRIEADVKPSTCALLAFFREHLK